MEDKQIIINEIDISKCDFCYDGEYCHIYSGTADFRWMCKENEDCQIKNLLLQLKQAENQIVELNKTIQAKEQECEELKDELILKDVVNIELSDEVKKYRKAIDEIEEIADNNYENPEMERIFKIIGGLDV